MRLSMSDELKALPLEKQAEFLKKPSQNSPLICMKDVQTESVQWLWHPYFPYGKITIMQGDPGMGKTFVAAQIAALITTGNPSPTDDNIPFKRELGKVLFQTAEDGVADTLKPRLEAAGADFNHLFFINESEQALTFDDERLRQALQTIRPKLVIFDPIQGFLGADVDMHRANEIRPIMSRLGGLASEFHCSILLIGHQNKAAGGKSIYRGLGSIDLPAAARSILTVAEVPDIKNRRAICHIKSSLAAAGDPVLFDLDPEQGFQWVGLSDMTTDEILFPDVEREAPERNEAEEFLREVLADGAMLSNEVFAEAKAVGIAKRTLERAKKGAGVKSFKENGFWYFKLKQESHSNTCGGHGGIGGLPADRDLQQESNSEPIGGLDDVGGLEQPSNVLII